MYFKRCLPLPNLPAYGSGYQALGTFDTATVNVPLDFDIVGPFNGVIPNPATDTLTVLKTGVYNVDAVTTVSLDSGEAITLGLYIGTPPAGSLAPGVPQRTAIATGAGQFALPVLGQVALNAGDVLSIRPVTVTGTVEYENFFFRADQII